MTKKVFTLFVFVILAVMLAYNVRNFFTGYRDPYIFSYAGTAEPKVVQGGVVKFIFRYDHIRFCETSMARFIANAADNEIVYRDRIPGGATPLGPQKVINPVRLNDEIGPGRYVMRYYLTATCPDGIHEISAPEIPFEVVPNN